MESRAGSVSRVVAVPVAPIAPCPFASCHPRSPSAQPRVADTVLSVRATYLITLSVMKMRDDACGRCSVPSALQRPRSPPPVLQVGFFRCTKFSLMLKPPGLALGARWWVMLKPSPGFSLTDLPPRTAGVHHKPGICVSCR